MSLNVSDARGVVVDAEGREKTEGARVSRLRLMGRERKEERGKCANHVERMRSID